MRHSERRREAGLILIASQRGSPQNRFVPQRPASRKSCHKVIKISTQRKGVTAPASVGRVHMAKCVMLPPWVEEAGRQTPPADQEDKERLLEGRGSLRRRVLV